MKCVMSIQRIDGQIANSAHRTSICVSKEGFRTEAYYLEGDPGKRNRLRGPETCEWPFIKRELETRKDYNVHAIWKNENMY